MEVLIEKLIGGVALVLLLIWAGAYLYLRLGGRRNGGEKGLIRVVDSTYIGPRKVITVVDVAGEYVVLGLTKDGITYLTKVDGLRGSKGESDTSR